MTFKLKIEPEVIHDIQEAIDWYNEQQLGLGKKFYNEAKHHFKILSKTPFFQIRYDEVRCLPFKKFPYMIHYTIDDANHIVIVRAVLNTYKSTKAWFRRQ